MPLAREFRKKAPCIWKMRRRAFYETTVVNSRVWRVSARHSARRTDCDYVQSSSGGFSGGTTAVAGSLAIDLGTIGMPAGSVGTYLIKGLRAGVNYVVSLIVSGTPGWDTLTAELLDPIGDGNDAADPASQPAYVPARLFDVQQYRWPQLCAGFSACAKRYLRRRFSDGDRRRANEPARRTDVCWPWLRDGAGDVRVA